MVLEIVLHTWEKSSHLFLVPALAPELQALFIPKGMLPGAPRSPPATASVHGFRSLSFLLRARSTRHCMGRRECCSRPRSCSEKPNSGITTASENSRQQNQPAKPHCARGWAVKQWHKQCAGSLAELFVFRNNNCSEQLSSIYMCQEEWLNFSIRFPGEGWNPLGRS